MSFLNRDEYELNMKSHKNEYKPNKKQEYIIIFLELFEKVIRRLLKDVYTYMNNLHKFLEIYQSCSNIEFYEIMENHLITISELFYKSMKNHLSISNNEYGISDKIIKEVNCDFGKTTTIKYCGTKKSYGVINIQNTINVATLDNITINKIVNKKDDKVLGYDVMIGELNYKIDINLKNENINDIINKIINNLEDIEICFESNIEYIKKCVSIFETNIK